jgi:isocitrate lyase
MLTDHQIALFQTELAKLGYKYQFVTLAGFHSLNAGMFELARHYSNEGMAAYARLQEKEFHLAATDGYTAIRHQTFVGTSYFDAVQNTITGGRMSTAALEGSTEAAQFAPTLADGMDGAAA